MWRGAWFDFKVLPIYGRWSPPEWYAPPVFPLQQEPHTVNDGWRALAFVCISCALVQQMQKGCLKGITKINCLTVRFAGHSWWHQNRRAWSMSSSHCSHYQWHSVCHIPFFESLSIPNPNGRAAITWFSLTFFFWHFFWQSQWHSVCHIACVEGLVQRLLHRLLLTIFFMTFFFWKKPMAQSVAYSLLKVSESRILLWRRHDDIWVLICGDETKAGWRPYDDEVAKTWRRHGGHLTTWPRYVELPAKHSYIAGKVAYYRHHADVLITS